MGFATLGLVISDCCGLAGSDCTCCFCYIVAASQVSVMVAGTQDSAEDDHIKDAGQTADLIEEADECQQPQGSGSGFDDDAELHESSSQADDQLVDSHQTPSSAVHENIQNGHSWHSALLTDSTSPADQPHQQERASQQLHHDRIAEAQQAHQVHRNFHHTLQGRGTPQHSGYQSMTGHHNVFNPSKLVSCLASNGLDIKPWEDPTVCGDPVYSNVAVGLVHPCSMFSSHVHASSAVIVHEVFCFTLGAYIEHILYYSV